MPRKLIEFHTEDLRALEELADDKSTSLQELMDEAVRDLLVKHRRFTNLRTALKESGSDSSPRPRKTS
ncbi:MAG: hypothetical protein ABW198_06795 [Pseudorhodoplanes sp.]